MSDVSNRTIVALLAVALVVSVAGTMYSVSELGALGGSYNIISGAATSSAVGTTDLFISSVVGISTATVDSGSADLSFGAGNPIDGTTCNTLNAAHFDSLHSQASLAALPSSQAAGVACWEYGSTHAPDSFVVVNTGNTDVNLSIKTYQVY